MIRFLHITQGNVLEPFLKQNFLKYANITPMNSNRPILANADEEYTYRHQCSEADDPFTPTKSFTISRYGIEPRAVPVEQLLFAPELKHEPNGTCG